ncbi:hypothetical protein, partial [Runella limosa]|uniref:hypothetical protein n=1 Tax=Runella limosa TaxID=370978 RepID=UPI001B7FCE01
STMTSWLSSPFDLVMAALPNFKTKMGFDMILVIFAAKVQRARVYPNFNGGGMATFLSSQSSTHPLLFLLHQENDSLVYCCQCECADRQGHFENERLRTLLQASFCVGSEC